MPSKVLVGARAKVYVDNQLVGIFESCTYNVNVGNEPIHLLGRYAPDEICVTSWDACTLSCSGFRVVGNGPHKLPKFPKLQDLMNFEAVQIAVIDRQSGRNIMTAIGCVPTSYNGNLNARATSRVTINYTGIRLADEEGAQDESGAVSLP